MCGVAATISPFQSPVTRTDALPGEELPSGTAVFVHMAEYGIDAFSFPSLSKITVL